MAVKTRATFQADQAAAFADNTTRNVTPAVLRGQITDLADSVAFGDGVGFALRWYEGVNVASVINSATNTSGRKKTFQFENDGFNFMNNADTSAFYIEAGAATVNRIQVSAANAGASPTISAAGSDANLDLRLIPKGTGRVRYGTHAAIAAETVTGFIEIKDAGGTVRKLAVVS